MEGSFRWHGALYGTKRVYVNSATERTSLDVKNPFIKLTLVGGFLLVSSGSYAATALTAQEVVVGLSAPVFVTSPPADSNRLFIVEQAGRIRIYKNSALLGTPFLDIQGLVSYGGERGLLGMAFHPDFAVNGYFFVNYTRAVDNTTVVARYEVSANADSADENSAQTIITVNQPYSNHNAGMLAFSPLDGYLYIGLGDGGAAGDPQNRAQDPKELLGKMLRVDVDGGSPYAVPGDNPWVGAVDTLDEIWAFGLRNPWRYSFDRGTGDLYTADVGQAGWEEVDFQSAGSSGGENYGWRLKEGTNCYNPPEDCDPGGILDDPIHVYAHSGGLCSITGGYVYRGCAIPDLHGTYFFSDYCTGQIWSFRYDGANLTEFQERTSELGMGAVRISSFGEDAYGEIYVIAYDQGRIYRIVPAGVPSQCNSCCVGIRGDVDYDMSLNVADLTYLVDYLFFDGPPPPCAEEGDSDGTGSTNVADMTYLVDHLFFGGPAPAPCP